MSKNIFIDSFGGNVIGALAKDDKLIEYHIEKSNKTQIVGSIYKGVVKNVLNGMQAAFVDIGLEKNGYLSATDMLIDTSGIITNSTLPNILNLKEGDEVMVQAVKDPSSTKGARLTSHVTFAGKYLVYAPTLDLNGVSRKITDEKTRLEIESYLKKLKRPSGGFIARTASKDIPYKVLALESKTLVNLYKSILKEYKKATAISQVYYDGDLPSRLMRDVLTDDIDKVYVADLEIYNKLCSLKQLESCLDKLVFYNENVDMFKKFSIDKEVENLLHNRVNLSNGAYIIIDKTEALTVIDVNTGGFVGETSIEETAFQTNMIASREIARQVRLRNISGIVVVDFIDMEDENHRNLLVEELTNNLKEDRRKCNVIGMTGLGLVEFTRNKKRKELSAFFNKQCPYCRGEGSILSNDYISMKIRTKLLDIFHNDYKSAIIDLNFEICDYILQKGALKKDIEKFWQNKRIYLIPHKTYHQEFFLIKGDNGDVLDLPDNAILLY